MAENTKIEWCDHTFNPWIGCSKVSAGCTNCYAETLMDTRYGKVQWGPNGTRVKTSEANWRKPLAWNREAERYPDKCEKCGVRLCGEAQMQLSGRCPAQYRDGKLDTSVTPCGGEILFGVRPRVFCASLADVFEDWPGQVSHHSALQIKLWRSLADNSLAAGVCCDEPEKWLPCTLDDLRADLFRLIDATPHLAWLLLTKRPENIRRMWVRRDGRDGKPGPLFRDNCWIGTSVENQEQADKRIPELLKCRDLSPVLWLSVEPLLGPVDLHRWLPPEQANWQCQKCGAFARDYGRCLWCGQHGMYLTGSHAANHSDPNRFTGSVNRQPIDWVVIGAESGRKRRPMELDWMRSIQQQCEAVGVAVFQKQMEIDGVVTGDIDRFPADLRVRQFPMCDLADGCRRFLPQSDPHEGGAVKSDGTNRSVD